MMIPTVSKQKWKALTIGWGLLKQDFGDLRVWAAVRVPVFGNNKRQNVNGC